MGRGSNARRLAGAFVGGVIGALVIAGLAPRDVRAQSAELTRAMTYETQSRWRDAAIAYREALDRGELMPALLGLERVYAQLGWNDSLVPVVTAVIRNNPSDPSARAVQLRVLHSLKRDTDAALAFRDWVRSAPGDPVPFREWSRILLADGRGAAVDSVLQFAQQSLGSMRGLTTEVAQLRATLGQWDHATVAWREAIGQHEYLEAAASFSLRTAPPDQRRVVRAVLLSPPVERGPRRLLASLELGWGNGREGWLALSALPMNDSTASVWGAFADDAERRGQWIAARDALLGLQQWRPDAQRVLRAATFALEGGDPQSALDLASQASSRIGGRDGQRAALNTQLRAYGLMGKGADAHRVYAAVESQLSPTERAASKHLVAWAWVRGGGVAEAKALLAGAAPDPDDELTGWLALYEGDLVGARRGLRRVDARAKDAVFALAFISRTRVDHAPLSGQAFLTLARGDSIPAAGIFIRAADEVADAGSVLLLLAARVYLDQRRDSSAVSLWKTIVESHASAPEAAEAELEWSRWLRKRGDKKSAIEHLEHLILTWPGSALLPQARRELELARGTIPPDSIRGK